MEIERDPTAYWKQARIAGLRQANYANRALGYDEIPLEALGERPVMPVTDNRHEGYIRDFDALVAVSVDTGVVAQEVGNIAMSNFRVYMTGNRCPQHSPKFFQ